MRTGRVTAAAMTSSLLETVYYMLWVMGHSTICLSESFFLRFFTVSTEQIVGQCGKFHLLERLLQKLFACKHKVYYMLWVIGHSTICLSKSFFLRFFTAPTAQDIGLLCMKFCGRRPDITEGLKRLQCRLVGEDSPYNSDFLFMILKVDKRFLALVEVLYYDSNMVGDPTDFGYVFLYTQVLEGITISMLLPSWRKRSS